MTIYVLGFVGIEGLKKGGGGVGMHMHTVGSVSL